MVTSKLGGGDKLAALMMMSQLIKDELLKEILSIVGEDAKRLPIDQLIERFIEKSTDGGHGTNWGTVRPPLSDEQMENGDFTPTPPRSLE